MSEESDEIDEIETIDNIEVQKDVEKLLAYNSGARAILRCAMLEQAETGKPFEEIINKNIENLNVLIDNPKEALSEFLKVRKSINRVRRGE